MSQAFTYPLRAAWGHERWHNASKDHDTEGKMRDGNFGMKLFNVMHKSGFSDLQANLIQPIIKSKEEKTLFTRGMSDAKQHYLEQGHTEDEWLKHCEDMNKIVQDDAAIIAFYQSCQVSGIKTD